MPSHPERVRRNYGPDRPTVPANRHLREGEPACTVCGSGKSTHVLSERGHPFVRTRLRAVDGVTANVIEGDHHDYWGV